MAIWVWGPRVSPLLVGWVSSKVQKGMAIVTQKLLILLLKDPNKNTNFENVLKFFRSVKVFSEFPCYTFISAGPWKLQMARKTAQVFSSVATTWGSAMRCLWRFEWCETLLRSSDWAEEHWLLLLIILEWRWKYTPKIFPGNRNECSRVLPFASQPFVREWFRVQEVSSPRLIILGPRPLAIVGTVDSSWFEAVTIALAWMIAKYSSIVTFTFLSSHSPVYKNLQ